MGGLLPFGGGPLSLFQGNASLVQSLSATKRAQFLCHIEVISDQREHVEPGRRVHAALLQFSRMILEAGFPQSDDGGQFTCR